MTEVTAISAQAAALLVRYFDLGGDTAEQFVAEWLVSYPAHWLRLALVEALYQGRYKAVSVEHILAIWQRRGQPLHHFNHEFERLVCSSSLQDSNPETETKQPQSDAILTKLTFPSSFVPFELPLEKTEVFQQKAEEEGREIESLPVQKIDSPQTQAENRETTDEKEKPESASASPNDEAAASSSEDEEESEDSSGPTIKYTDFYSKLKAVAEAKKKEEDRRKRRDRRS